MKATRHSAIVILVFVILGANMVRADDLILANGNKRTGVTVSRVEPDGVVVMTDSGIEKIPFAELSAETQHRYGYNAAKAAAYSAAVTQAATLREKQIQAFRKAQLKARVADAAREVEQAAEAKVAAQKAKEAEEEKIRSAVTVAIQSELKDPDSLRIDSISVKNETSQGSGVDWKPTGNIIATVEFNAKNSYGGYGNGGTAVVIVRPDGSTICSIQE